MTLTRRTLLRAGGAALVGWRCAGALDLKLSDSASYDDVLDALRGTDFEFGAGLSNHGPMAADALVASGRADRVVPFIQGYSRQLITRTQQPPLGVAERASALGNYEKREEWAATYEQELETLNPRALLAQEWPTLVSGFLGAGWHGILRTAHAARAVDREDTTSRRRELAQGMAFWASRHQTLAGTPGAQAIAGLDVVSALKRVTPIPASERTRGTLIVHGFEPLARHPEFAQAVEEVDLNAQPVDAALTGLVASAARMMFNGGKKDIALLHGVTGTAALRLVMPWLTVEQQRLGVGYAFQTLAGLFAAQASSSAVFDPVPDPTMTSEELLAISTDSRDEHAIKFTEMAVRESALTGRPELLTAAQGYMT